MKLSPFMKKVEIEGGYRGFHRYGDSKITVTVEENGIAVTVDKRKGLPSETGEVIKLFKPMANLWDGKKYMESFCDTQFVDLQNHGFIEVKSIII